MKESVVITKEADAKKDFSPTKSDNRIHRIQSEPERQLGSLRGVLDDIRRDGGTPSVDSIATELSKMPAAAQRAPALLALQRTHGNRYVQQVVAGIQAKLKVGQPGDIYEQEADRVAEEVMRMPEPKVERYPEEEKKKEEEGIVQIKEVPGQTPEIAPDIESHIQALRGSGQSLPESVRNFFEPRFGYDFSHVRVHIDARAAESARAVNARAFTVGRDVVFGAGQYAPETMAGKRLLAHELTHVIQQNRYFPKEVPALVNRKVERTNDEEPLESYTRGPMPWSVGATTPDGVDLGPTNATDAFCHRGTFLGIYGVSQNTATTAKGNAAITFRGASTGRQSGRACSCGCGVYRQWIQHYWRVGSPTAPKRYDFSSCGHPMTASENSWTEEYTSCFNASGSDPCRFSYSDFPGLLGLSNGTYAEAWYRFKYQIWDSCRGRPVSTAFNTLTISGSNAPRTIRWSRS